MAIFFFLFTNQVKEQSIIESKIRSFFCLLLSPKAMASSKLHNTHQVVITIAFEAGFLMEDIPFAPNMSILNNRILVTVVMPNVMYVKWMNILIVRIHVHS